MLFRSIRVFVKHENHHPTQSFKIRNGLNAILALSDAERGRGVIGASTGNHGLGLAYAGRLTGTQVTICVPEHNNPGKNAAIRALGAELVEAGRTYDETIVACRRMQEERALTLVHSTNNANVIAGAGTMTLELLEQEPELDASLDVRGNVELAVADTRNLLKRFEEVSMAFGEVSTDEEMNALIEEQAKLQDRIDAVNAWDLDRHLEVAMDALRLPPGDTDVSTLSGGERRRVALCRVLQIGRAHV